MTVHRLDNNPIIHPGLSPSIGSNINGPSLIRVPDWVNRPLGQYYLYFAHHQGKHIRLAYADQLTGPWHIYEDGCLQLEDTAARSHIASPDVHIDASRRQIAMVFHGCTAEGQRSFRATSGDGLRFEAEPTVIGLFYMRVFQHDGAYYAIAKDENRGGVLMRSPDGITPYERGPDAIPRMRHAAVLKTDTTLLIAYSRGEDCPERLLLSRMPLLGDWREWQADEPTELLAPETSWEGADLPLQASRFGAVHEPVHQLRDPAFFTADGTTYLLYSVAGESGIAIARCDDGG